MLLYTETRKRNPSRSRARRELGLGGRNLYKSSVHFCTVTDVDARVSRFRPDNEAPIQNVWDTGQSKRLFFFILDYKLAKCCSSISGDEIFGFITINEGIKVHNVNCPNAIQLQSRYAYRIMKAEWATIENLKYSAVLSVKGFDQIGLVNKITKLISNEMNVNISSINIKSNNGIFDGIISLIVINKVHLENLINKLESIEGVESVERL